MAAINGRVKPEDWDCSICLSVMDGVNHGEVAISKRCFHIFHKVCLEEWLDKGRRDCPPCKLNYLSSRDIVLNPGYAEQYRKWQASPHTYTYARAFREECGQTPEQLGLRPEDILRPRELRGLDRRETLTSEELDFLWKERSAAVQTMGMHLTDAQLEKIKREALEAQDLVIADNGRRLNEISEGFADTREGFAQIREGFSQIDEENKRQSKEVAKINAALDHTLEVHDYYIEKANAFKTRIGEAIYKLIVPHQKPEDADPFMGELLRVEFALSSFMKEFLDKGRADKDSIEEAQVRVKKVDAELDAFIASQPFRVKEILGVPFEKPLPEEPEVAGPVPEPQKREGYIQNDAAKCRNFLRISLFAGCVWGLLKLKDYIYKTFWEKRSKTS